MAEVINLDALEDRIKSIEKQLFGTVDDDVEYPREEDQVLDTLIGVNNQMSTAVTGKPKIEGVLKRVTELEKCLDPAFTEKLTLSDSAKVEIILAEEEFLRQQAAGLEKLQSLEEVVNSEHIKVVPALEAKLHALSQVHIEQQDKASGITEDVKDMLLQYNKIISILSKQFVHWDEVLTNLEQEKQNKTS